MSRQKSPEKRTVRFQFRANEEEAALIRARMRESGVVSLGAYMRKQAIDGYFVHFDFTDVRELVTLLRRCSNNLNQYARRANETGSIYDADIKDLREQMDVLWDKADAILVSLSNLQL